MQNTAAACFLESNVSLLLPQLHGDDRVLASKAGAPTILLWAGFPHLRHLLKLQRGALCPPQHHICQHWEVNALPLASHLYIVFLGFVLWALYLLIPTLPFPAPLSCGAWLLHLKAKGVGHLRDRLRKQGTTVFSCQTLDTECWGHHRLLWSCSQPCL